MDFGQLISWADQSQSGTEHATFDQHVSSATFITQQTTDSIVTLGIMQQTASWDYAETQILQEI